MIDDLGISNELEISLCSSCHNSLVGSKKTSRDSLTNYRCICLVLKEFQNLNWLQESLISRSHFIGKVIRLQNRNATSYFSSKGHTVLVPEETQKLIDLLLILPDSLLHSIRVV